MIDGFSEAQLIGGLFAVIGGLITIMLAMIGAFGWWVIRRIERVEDRVDALDGKLERLDTKLSARLDAVEDRLGTKIDALTVAVARLEGAVYHGLPEPREAKPG